MLHLYVSPNIHKSRARALNGPYENEYIFRVYFFHRNISWITKYWKTWYRTYTYEYREPSVLCINCLHWQYIMFRETRISGSAVTGCREFTVESRTAESMLGTKRKSALLSQLNSRPLCSQLFTVTVSCNAAPWRKNWVFKADAELFETENRTPSKLMVDYLFLPARFLLTACIACKTQKC